MGHVLPIIYWETFGKVDKGWIGVSTRLLPCTFGRLSLSKARVQYNLRVQLFP